MGKFDVDDSCLFGKDAPMDPLTSYLQRRGERVSAFAIRIGRAPSTLSRVLSGARNPSIDLARDVERGTGGHVSAAAFLAACIAGSGATEATE